MLEFDALPNSSRSFWAEAAARDIAGMSANFRLFRILIILFVVGFIFSLFKISSLASKIFGAIGINLAPEFFTTTILCILFVLTWLFIVRTHKRLLANSFLMLSPQRQQAIRSVDSMVQYLQPTMGMLAENLTDARRRMLKVFSSGDERLSQQLISAFLGVLNSKEFIGLAESDFHFRHHLEQLTLELTDISEHESK